MLVGMDIEQFAQEQSLNMDVNCEQDFGSMLFNNSTKNL